MHVRVCVFSFQNEKTYVRHTTTCEGEGEEMSTVILFFKKNMHTSLKLLFVCCHNGLFCCCCSCSVPSSLSSTTPFAFFPHLFLFSFSATNTHNCPVPSPPPLALLLSFYLRQSSDCAFSTITASRDNCALPHLFNSIFLLISLFLPRCRQKRTSIPSSMAN
jgi:hypothetical protein